MKTLGLALTLLSWCLVATALVLFTLAARDGLTEDIFLYTDAVVGVVLPGLGLLILRRHGPHPIAWILIVMGLSGAIGVFSEEYITYGHDLNPGSLPAVGMIAWLGSWIRTLFFYLLPVLLLLFPDGKPVSRSWRVMVGVSAAPALVLPSLVAISVIGYPIDVLADLEGVTIGGPVTDAISTVGLALWYVALVASMISLGVRWWRSRGIQRLQMKVFFFFAAAGTIVYMISQIGPSFRPLSFVAFLLFPAGVAGAILRYRLYDIDRIVSRTVGYTIVVAILALVYVVGAVWLPSQLIGEQPPLFVAGATLMAAALFNPIRTRVLAWVDRRFYRSRYDAERVVASFSVRLRDTVDTRRLTDDWVSVVTNTMQPASVGVWLRE
ncbi:MAG: hypothetical protein GEU79_17860 [Acidimicrobiia bacterium]|nr:hypothetical protein [Acidimicrobiia bacterium]